jgi:hypothetical protein
MVFGAFGYAKRRQVVDRMTEQQRRGSDRRLQRGRSGQISGQVRFRPTEHLLLNTELSDAIPDRRSNADAASRNNLSGTRCSHADEV